MAADPANLARALAFVFGHEGGLSLDRNDRGNWTSGVVGQGELKGTKFGIAAHVYPQLDIRNLTLAQATEIYRRDYAAKIRFDLLAAGVDVMMLDTAINSGPGRAVKLAQKVTGVRQSGALGPETLAAIAAVRDVVAFIRAYCAARLSFLRSLTELWALYRNGWTRRVTELEPFAVAEYLRSIGRSEASIAASAEHEAAAAGRSERRNQAGAATSGAGGTGAVAVDPAPAPDVGAGVPLPRPNPDRVPSIDGFPVDVLLTIGAIAAFVLVAFFAWRAFWQGQRRASYGRLARGGGKRP